MEKTNYFSIIPTHILCRKDLTANAKLCIALITSLTHEEGYCYASNVYLSGKLGISKKSVERILRELKDADLISVMVIRDENNRFVERKILSVLTQPPLNRKETSPLNIGDPSPLNIGLNNKDINNKEDITPYSPPKGDVNLLDGFNDFWDAYDYKKGKEASMKIWKRLKLHRKADEVISGAKSYARTRGNEKRFWKHPSGWLNAGRWEDEYGSVHYLDTEENMPF